MLDLLYVTHLPTPIDSYCMTTFCLTVHKDTHSFVYNVMVSNVRFSFVNSGLCTNIHKRTH